jgi:hypothetical protein
MTATSVDGDCRWQAEHAGPRARERHPRLASRSEAEDRQWHDQPFGGSPQLPLGSRNDVGVPVLAWRAALGPCSLPHGPDGSPALGDQDDRLAD